MQTPQQPVLRDIVLVGGGHSHVGVLRHFAMHPVAGVRLTLICRDTQTPYSGMLPGYIAGHYSYEEVHIDLRRLAALAGARFFKSEVVGLDRANSLALCSNRPPVAYDRLSINIGSTPQTQQVDGAAEHATAVKPIHLFNQRWLALLERVRQQSGKTRIAVVGGGAGGVELTLAMQHRLRHELRQLGRDPNELSFHLFTASDSILPTHNQRVRRTFEHVLSERQVVLHCSSAVTQVSATKLHTADGDSFDIDEVIWVTQAGGAPWLASTGLALDDQGFIKVNSYLQCLSDSKVFAAGDIAALVDHPLEKAGVFAVRQAKPLAVNLARSLQGLPLLPYRPQRRWLALISTGDRYAVASRGALSWHGAWVWRWKDRIDRRFMERFRPAAMRSVTRMRGARSPSAPPVELSRDEGFEAATASAMRCGGCGAKVGASVLTRALGNLQPRANPDVLIGLQASDDAAVVQVPLGKAMVHSVDFFRAFIDDPYLFGQIAANHALGDIFAMGGQAQSATAIATLPPGVARKVEDTVFQMMTGANDVLSQADCALVGGHTGEGQELALGFAINGLVDANLKGVLRKAGMRVGDLLILTKPLGTGTLLVAHAKQEAKGDWIDAALATMLQSNQDAAACLLNHGATACTDITGFGLVGHLVEMAKASQVNAELNLASLALLEGAAQASAAGHLSSLHSANLQQRESLGVTTASVWTHKNFNLLFDPQTAGGLLASVPEGSATACITALHAAGYGRACVVGRVLPPTGQPESIALVA